jgi:hypothetical protein
MAQTGFTPIVLYNSGTTTNAPIAADLTAGELGLNYKDGLLFYKDDANAIQKIGYKLTPIAAGGTGAITAQLAINALVGSVTNGYLVQGNGTNIVLSTAPTFNQDTTGKSAKTDALNSATTVVNVSSATAPTNGQVLTATSGTAATWQTVATVATVADQTHAAASKTTPVDADEIPLADSAATFGLKKLTWANLKAGIAASTPAPVAPTGSTLYLYSLYGAL